MVSIAERGILFLGSKPGSGKGHLGTELAKSLPSEIRTSVEHFSIGDRVRAIGSGAISAYSQELPLITPNRIQPINDSLIANIVREYLAEKSETGLILLDGYPRYLQQVATIFEIASEFDLQIYGMIMTDVSDETALVRMLKRAKTHPDRPPISDDAARDKLQMHNDHFPAVTAALEMRGVPIEVIDTTYSKKPRFLMACLLLHI